jgi:pimeloyl-ACP methyl ester carboxylesterase
VKPLLRNVGWWVQDYCYAAYWQLRGALSRTPAERFRSGTKPPVVVLPGIYESWQFMLPLIEAIHSDGHPVYVIPGLRRNRKAVRDAAHLVAGFISAEGLRDVVIVAHSKGGMVGKFAMLRLDGEARIAHMIAICSPFSGSRYARYLPVPSLRAFSPANALTLQLAREELVNERITSIFGLFDPHIPEGSLLPGARNIQLGSGGHFRILGDAQTLRTVLHVLDDGAAQQ